MNELMHMVLRLKENLPGFFQPRDQQLRDLFYLVANKNQVKIEELIFNHSHTHLVIVVGRRESYQAFTRELTSKIVIYLSKSIGVRLRHIFEHRPFTRIVIGFGGLARISKYMKKNERESGVQQIPRYGGLQRLFADAISSCPPGQLSFVT